MRKVTGLAIASFVLALAAGCGDAGRRAEMGHPTVYTVPNPRAAIADPTRAFRDPNIGPPPPRTAEIYRIRTGDVLEVGIWGEDDMTKEVTVGPDGRISYMLATEMRASGRTLTEIKTQLEGKLEEYYKSPKVFVSLVNSAGNFVSVTGIVKAPGIYRITNETRVVDVIAQAGGIPLGSSRFGEAFTEIADLSQAFVLRGNRFLNVDFEVLFGHKRWGARAIALNNVLLQPNDRVYIPSAVRLENKVYVVGAVRAPQMIRFSKQISFLEAVVRAGDVPEAAWERRSFVIRGRMNQPKIIPVNARDVRTGRIPDIRLEPGDVIFVPKTPLGKIADVVSQLDVVFKSVFDAEQAYKVRFDRD
jgi:protein involved in polysaccharide export with SLBB domain